MLIAELISELFSELFSELVPQRLPWSRILPADYFPGIISPLSSI